ncbi:MAG: Unknown protein [uncultured Sulfurovum sp.]|uniref:Lipoprotein n=1 Tax=uncultured Sulfurovum sp. TaxID=269237 RepID=A0A6S6TSG8_9BACT|nr:MAG: Unknown protein [uncultured Sulfurovum sp.]
MLFRLLFFLFLLLGCSVKEPSVEVLNEKIRNLELLLIGLSPNVSRMEAKDFAKNSVNFSQQLAKEYKSVRFPWVHNTFVNLGIRQRGLCYEWGEDLFKFLSQQGYQTLKLHAIGANIADLNEHNALAVSAKNQGIKKSIVLDAWRDSGNLYFNKISEDLNYKWKERFGLYDSLK